MINTRSDNKSFIYSSPLIYQLTMRLLYRRGFGSRYEAIAKYIPDHASVVDVCCGDCYLFHHYLKYKAVDYIGLDINRSFVNDALKRGVKAKLFDINIDPLPSAEYIIMQASLYQFIPNQKTILDKLFNSATRGVIITEPIRNLSDSKNPVIAFIARRAANPGSGHAKNRFDENSLLQLLKSRQQPMSTCFKIKGDKELVAIFELKDTK